MKKIVATFAALIFCGIAFSQTHNFQFKYTNGENSRIISTVDEDVYVNGLFFHSTKILNRIFCKTTATDSKGRGKLEATFMTSETSNAKGQSFSWGNKYESVFWRDARGVYDISDEYFMPTVRDVPVFPKPNLTKGAKWTYSGHEAHDMRQTFGVDKPFKVPFTANYEYLGDEYNEEKKKSFAVIKAEYDLSFKSPVEIVTEDLMNSPATTTGYSHQKIFWDYEKGNIDNYSEEFSIEIKTFSGNKITFKGTATSRVNEVEQVATAENLKKISESVNTMGLENIDVKKSDKGIIISVENIQFKADSAVLEESEKKKLLRISEILKKYKNDLLITGYCANIGTQESQKVLSEERAASVAEFLSTLKVRTPECIFTEGKGSENPLASDATAEGRAKNRRVEITIVDE